MTALGSKVVSQC